MAHAEKKANFYYIPASEEEFKRLGGEIMNRDPEGKSEPVFLRRFVNFFGVEPVTVAQVWTMLEIPAAPEDDEGELNGAKPDHLLWAMLFLKKYGDEWEHATLCGPEKGAVDEKTFRKWSQIFVIRIACLVMDVVSLYALQTSLSAWLLIFCRPFLIDLLPSSLQDSLGTAVQRRQVQ